MNSFYSELIEEIPKFEEYGDAFIYILFNIFTENKYQLEEFLILVKSFFLKMKKYKLTEDEEYDFFVEYVNKFEEVEYNLDLFEEMLQIEAPGELEDLDTKNIT